MIVMKFGGTSVKDAVAINNAIEIIKTRLARKPVIVSSATAKTTDSLIQLGKSACIGDGNKTRELLDELRERHLKICRELINDSQRQKNLSNKIISIFAELENIVNGIFLLSELSSRSLAKVSSFGEIISTTIISEALSDRGIANEWVDVKNFMLTNDNYQNAEPLFSEIKERTPEVLCPIIEPGKVAVTQGFIGSTHEGITTTFSRGGSDFTASIIGMSMNAEEIEIWTDVDGVLSADPRIVSSPKIIDEISFKEAAELAFFGAKVLHPSTIVPAVEKNIPVRILNSKNPQSKGTLIKSDVKEDGFAIKSITSKKDIKVINIYSPKMLFAHGFLRRIFEIFDKYKTSVDLITTSEVNVSLTLDAYDRIDDIITELSEFSEVKIEDDKSLICIVGNNMKYERGIEKKIFQVLGDCNISMISQGASVINLSFVVERNEMDSVIKTLHKEFFE
jgi:aspartate kinase